MFPFERENVWFCPICGEKIELLLVGGVKEALTHLAKHIENVSKNYEEKKDF